MHRPKCELPKVIIRHNIGPISAAKSRPLLLGQCHCLHRSSAGLSTAAFCDCLNLPTFSRNLAQYRPYTKPIVILSFQQRHNIGSRSSANFCRCWASVGPYLISHLGYSPDLDLCFFFLCSKLKQSLPVRKFSSYLGDEKSRETLE